VTRAKTSQATDKRRRRQVEVIKVEGTPAATPLAPTLPAGYSLWYQVNVAQNEVATFSGQEIYDYRVPAGGIKTHAVSGRDIIEGSGSVGTRQEGGSYFTNVGGDVAIFPLRHDCFAAARLVAFQVEATFIANVTVELVSFLHGQAAAGSVTVLSTLTGTIGTSGWFSPMMSPGSFNEDRPIWSMGRYSHFSSIDTLSAATSGRMLGVRLTAGAGGEEWRFVKFAMAEPNPL
jgi:hypothetical protein